MGLAEKMSAGGFSGRLAGAEPLSGYCSIGVGGPAELLAVPENMADLSMLMQVIREDGLPHCLLGGGTNVIFSNGGFAGCVIRLGSAFTHIATAGGGIVVGAAVTTARLLAHCRRHGLAGLEFLVGIPGTVGGALRMNAGVPGLEIGSRVRQLQLHRGGKTEGAVWVDRADLDFRYRDLTGLGEADVILAAELEVEPSTPEEVLAGIEKMQDMRRGKQPMALPSAGCWFKNPPGDSAGRLIDAAGLKGSRVGGAAVSEIHANFLVNEGGATAEDLLRLARLVREAVQDKFGVTLEEEVHVF